MTQTWILNFATKQLQNLLHADNWNLDTFSLLQSPLHLIRHCRNYLYLAAEQELLHSIDTRRQTGWSKCGTRTGRNATAESLISYPASVQSFWNNPPMSDMFQAISPLHPSRTFRCGLVTSPGWERPWCVLETNHRMRHTVSWFLNPACLIDMWSDRLNRHENDDTWHFYRPDLVSNAYCYAVNIQRWI